MGWTRQMEKAAETLDRIVALLLFMADLAERAAGVSEAKRRTVLAILRHGEAFACHAFRIQTVTDGRSSPAAPDSCRGDTAEDAMALAMSLRFLALIVRGMAAPQHRVALAGRARSFGEPHDDLAIVLDRVSSTHRLDTS